jgi:hypothetical protein
MMIWHKKHKISKKKGDLCAQISRTIDNIILLVPSKRRLKFLIHGHVAVRPAHILTSVRSQKTDLQIR